MKMCGIIGVQINKPSINVSKALFSIFSNQCTRGQNGAGLALLRNGAIRRIRVKTPFYLFSPAFYSFWHNLKKGDCIILHHRMPTSGCGGDVITSNHPIMDEDKKIAIIHNGMVYNDDALHNNLKKQNHKFETETNKGITDSEIFAHYLERGVIDGIKAIHADVNGMTALAFLCSGDNGIYLYKDGTAPIETYFDSDQNIYFSSEYPENSGFHRVYNIKPYRLYKIEDMQLKKLLKLQPKKTITYFYSKVNKKFWNYYGWQDYGNF